MSNLKVAVISEDVKDSGIGSVVLGRIFDLSRSAALGACISAGLLGHAMPASAAVKPDMSSVLRLSGRFGLAHGCPISADLAITAAHVIDHAPFSDTPLFPEMWSDGNGHIGVAEGFSVDNFRDLGRLRPRNVKFASWYSVATNAPLPGDKVFMLGYDYGSRSDAFADKLYELKVLRVIGGVIVMDNSSKPGSSGGCVLNSAGEAIGVVAWSHEVGHGEDVGFATGIWGDLLSISKPREAELIVIDGGDVR